MTRIWYVLGLLLLASTANAQNFLARHPDPKVSLQLANAAEQMRHELAVKWFGKPLPNWSEPCVLAWKPARFASGVTIYSFRNRRPVNMEMEVAGTFTDVMRDSLPHEVMHLVLATRFGYHVPRWLDEGLSSNVESVTTLSRLDSNAAKYLRTQRGIPTNVMMQMKEYPQDVQAFYAQSSSLTRFLLWRGGVETFEKAIDKRELTPTRFARLFAFNSVSDMQNRWVDWIQDGSPRIKRVLQPSYCDTMGDCNPQSYQAVPFVPNRGGMQSQPYIPQTPYGDQAVPRVDPVGPVTAQPKPTVGITDEGPADYVIKCQCDCGSGGVTIEEGDKRWILKGSELAAGKDGRDGQDGRPGKDGMPGEPGPAGPPGKSPDINEVVDAVLARLKTEPPTSPQPEPNAGDSGAINDGNDEPPRMTRVLYFTSRGCQRCEEANAIAERLKAAGFPVTIITLAERDAAVEGVPRVFVPDTDRTVLGASNVATFLSTFFP